MIAETVRHIQLGPKALSALTGYEHFFKQCPTCSGAGVSARDVQLNLWGCNSQQALCSHCAPAKQGVGETILQVRRSSYHDVVKMADIARLTDISGIQSYVINGSKVVFLRRRPQPRPPKGAVGVSQCTICSRHLQDLSRYCSLQCRLDGEAGMGPVSLRLDASSGASGDSGLLDLRALNELGSDSESGFDSQVSTSGSRKRKCFQPSRAPLQ